MASKATAVEVVRYEEMVIDYWKTREKEEPQNAFYQEGEMANEAARLCIDAGDLTTAERMYKRGAELGNKEPEPRTHPKSLWDFRIAHALARVAARKGDKAEAQRQVAAARKALDGDPTMAANQERFFPYLTGYVAFYTNDLKAAEADLTKALSMQGNSNDPFMNALMGMVHDKMGHAACGEAVLSEGVRPGDAAQSAERVRAAVREEEARDFLTSSTLRAAPPPGPPATRAMPERTTPLRQRAR